jgi:hypothetical protein
MVGTAFNIIFSHLEQVKEMGEEYGREEREDDRR